MEDSSRPAGRMGRSQGYGGRRCKGLLLEIAAQRYRADGDALYQNAACFGSGEISTGRAAAAAAVVGAVFPRLAPGLLFYGRAVQRAISKGPADDGFIQRLYVAGYFYFLSGLVWAGIADHAATD